ncbi:hypothetical protein CE719_000632, partial [Salmonella enterica subsp. enterica serovar Javiana]|nr:hypothetical protein [Salmonella enterica]EDT9762322.1 hypothetical protein [Salmonella enterica subsp. enterica serovar Javiana]ECW8479141.1 hypothetical protein [Salmonella enterica]EDV7294991.1 hypothetical protein [Salmonella enterica subsp. enterica serovar Javiana]EDW3308240.1 hypothetical protein [Salmonella enterica]
WRRLDAIVFTLYLRPQVHFLSKPGRTVALFCLAEGLSYDIVAVLAELLVGINDCAPCLPMPIPNSF